MTKPHPQGLVRLLRYAVPHAGREPLYRFSIGSMPAHIAGHGSLRRMAR
ncbi:hypothetical protein CBM2609_A60154 [Cupriavidus taiwanensis]|nr:hypothetical protein [Cupriavidus taiwanensis]SOZ15313.1 hypothetical protein CBM2604_A50153 [Cupriavidus taiwanensis]SOZ27557.1 hypothetical protein CBM2609_A60154 [Cupriavidus taiwanensis]SOZ45884.1 hypothetical protein CBM2610_A70152 [Cupriavidus taiwanensis]